MREGGTCGWVVGAHKCLFISQPGMDACSSVSPGWMPVHQSVRDGCLFISQSGMETRGPLECCKCCAPPSPPSPPPRLQTSGPWPNTLCATWDSISGLIVQQACSFAASQQWVLPPVNGSAVQPTQVGTKYDAYFYAPAGPGHRSFVSCP